MNLHPVTRIEQLLSLKSALQVLLGDALECAGDAADDIERAIASVEGTAHFVAGRYGDDFFPARSAEAVLADFDRPLAAANARLGAKVLSLSEWRRGELKIAAE